MDTPPTDTPPVDAPPHKRGCYQFGCYRYGCWQYPIPTTLVRLRVNAGSTNRLSLRDWCTDIQRRFPPLFHCKRKKPWIDVSIQGEKPLPLHGYETEAANLFKNNSFIFNCIPPGSSILPVASRRYSASILNSTRRFLRRPASVALLATGYLSLWPTVRMRSAAMPA